MAKDLRKILVITDNLVVFDNIKDWEPDALVLCTSRLDPELGKLLYWPTEVICVTIKDCEVLPQLYASETFTGIVVCLNCPASNLLSRKLLSLPIYRYAYKHGDYFDYRD